MNSIRFLLCLVLMSFSISAIIADDSMNIAPARLTTKQLIALQVDILAKAISQQRPHYMRMVFPEEVTVNGSKLPKDTAICNILKFFGGGKTDLYRDNVRNLRGTKRSGPKSAGVSLVETDKAIGCLTIIEIPFENGDTLSRSCPIKINLVFGKTLTMWHIISLTWTD